MRELDKIENILMSKENISIKKEDIDIWKQSSDIEILGALEELMTEHTYYIKIEPKLTFDDYHPFLFNYYITCMQNNFEGEWSHSSYAAAYSLRSFIEGVWSDKQLSEKQKKQLKKEIKNKLEELCISSENSFKIVLINGLLEHLFENDTIKNYFKDWKKKNILDEFFECAIDKFKAIE